MSQLFTIFFPKFWFDLQKEYEITFSDPTHLPFEILEDKGSIFVHNVEPPRHSHFRPSGSKNQLSMLTDGLRIVAINGENVTNKQMNFDEFDKMIKESTDSVIITFCEEIELGTNNNHHKLGLGYDHKEDTFVQNSRSDDAMNQSLESNSRSDSNLLHISSLLQQTSTFSVENDQLAASSFQEGFEAYEARLHNPNSCWKPLSNDLASIQIDLKNISQITEIHVQGNHDHTMFCQSIWIDKSYDGCEWKCVSHREMDCSYNDEGIAIITTWPVIMTRFIRIRPQKWHHHIALRMELYGHGSVQTVANLLNARVVTLSDVDAENRKQLLEKTRNLPVDTKVIQVDCRQVIATALDRAGIEDVSYLKCSTRDHLLCVFSTKDVEESERALDNLTDVGVGKEMGVINVMSVDYRNENTSIDKMRDVQKHKRSSGPSFSKSIKSRRLVEQIIDRVMQSAMLTFDYVMMLIVASLIAVGGLATSNSVIIVASMLVSPIMGPVLALTFGATLGEKDMATIGLRNEMISIVVCIVVGFVGGYLYTWISQNSMDWPTSEMMGRGHPIALADGAFIAAVSGIGVALSVLGDYVATIIGVAISASLLPPAVNAGMLAAFALYENQYPDDVHHAEDKDVWNDGLHLYSHRELGEMAGWSLLLTIENILIIFVVALAMFKLKEVVKIKDRNEPLWSSMVNFKSKFDSVLLSHNRLARRGDIFIKQNKELHDVSDSLKNIVLKQHVQEISRTGTQSLRSSLGMDHSIPLGVVDDEKCGKADARTSITRINQIFEQT
eukprot:177201_1